MARRDPNIDIDTRHSEFDVIRYEGVIRSLSEQLSSNPTSSFYTTWDESTPEKPKTDPRRLLIK